MPRKSWSMKSASSARAVVASLPALDLLKKGAIELDSMISEEYPLSKGHVRSGPRQSKGCVKGAIETVSRQEAGRQKQEAGAGDGRGRRARRQLVFMQP